MKKNLLFVASALLVASLASCGGNNNPSGESEISKDEATKLVNGFDKKLSTTVKATYTADYFLDVETENVGAKGFARKIKETSTIEADFTSGNLYFHIKTVGRNLLTEENDSTKEGLVYKNGENYFYLTNTVADPIALQDENAALTQISTLMKKLSYREGGYVDSGVFLYDEIGTYEHHYFNLDSTNVDPDTALNSQKFAKTQDEGLKVTTVFDYVGYGTDQGTSDLGDNAIAEVVLETNKAGQVLSFNETYKNASLEMPIMTPAPILKLNGTRTLTARYDETITRLETIDHEAVFGDLLIKDSYEGGNVQVLTCEPMAFNNMKPAKNGDKVQVGNWICIKPTPHGTNTIKAVLLNNTSTPLADPAVAGGFYCYEAVEGTNEVKVVFEGDDISTTAKYTINKDANVENVEMVKFLVSNPQEMTPVTENLEVEVEPNLWIGLKITTKEGFDVDTVKISDKASMLIEGFHCFSVTQTGNFTIDITTKAKTSVEETSKIVVANAYVGGTVKVQYSLASAPERPLELPKDNLIPVGSNLVITATPDEGNTFKEAKVGTNVAKAPFPGAPFVSLVTTAGDNALEVTFEGENLNTTEAVINVTGATTEQYSVSELKLVGQNPSDFAPVTDKTATPGENKWVAIKLSEGLQATVTCNGQATNFIAKMYCFQIPVAGTYSVTITLNA